MGGYQSMAAAPSPGLCCSVMDPDLTIVLLGKTGVGKSAAGNTILGRTAFESDFRSSSVTEEISVETGRVFEKQISVIDTPGILDSEETAENIKTYCQNLLQSRKRCLFLVVLSIGRFTQEDQMAVDAAKRVLGDQGSRKSYLLFTNGDKLQGRSLRDFIFAEKDSKLADVVMMFSGAFHLFNNVDGDQEQVRDLLLKTGHLRDQLLLDPTAPGRTRRKSIEEPPSVSDIRLVLVGKTGAGRSSSGNTILGRNAFRADVSQSSVTNECCKQQDKLSNRMLSVIDTPGFFDTSLPEPTVKREISKCINMSAPGPHAILLVIRVGRFTKEERDAVKKVEEIFGEDAWRYTMVLFTHGDQVMSDFDEKINTVEPELQEILKKVGNRYHVFNNLKADDRRQVLDLLVKVDEMVKANGGQFYSNDNYQEVVEMLDQRESQLREFYQKKLEEKIKAVESEYKRKLMEAHEERQQVEEQYQMELEEVNRFYKSLGSRVRHAVEQMAKEDSFDDFCNKFYQTLKLN